MRRICLDLFYKDSSSTRSVEKSISGAGGESEGVTREAEVEAWRPVEMLFGAKAREPSLGFWPWP